jgi:hypothetical protein
MLSNVLQVFEQLPQRDPDIHGQFNVKAVEIGVAEEQVAPCAKAEPTGERRSGWPAGSRPTNANSGPIATRWGSRRDRYVRGRTPT